MAETAEARRAAIAARRYVPILKAKQGERLALRDLDAATRSAITPAFQLLPGRGDAQLGREMRQLGVAWSGVSPVLLDATWADPASTSDHPLIVASTLAAAEGVAVVPMVRPGSDLGHLVAAKAVVAAHGQGAAIRVEAAGWQAGKSALFVDPLLRGLSLRPEDVDLVLDAGALGSDADLALFQSLLAGGLPTFAHLDEWRRVVVAGGSFPADLRAVPAGVLTRLPRREWELWARRPRVARVLSYGDYGVAHPATVDEMTNPRAIPLWAQFRYTSTVSFLVAKGGDIKKSGDAEFYRAAALIAGAPEFDGRTFSAADAFLAARASGTGSPGGYSTWRRHGTGRHLTKVAALLATPSGP